MIDNDQIVIRASGVSKTYRLWKARGDRLAHLLNRVLLLFLPKWLGKYFAMKPRYEEFHALQDISFEIKKGESWGVIGVNGSGKSTLLQIISGNLRPTSGMVEVEGNVAILNYNSGLNGEFTGRENVYLKGTLLGLTRQEVDEQIQSIEEFADIGDFFDQPVKTYSSGMSARLGFAVMAHVGADIMISDEALAVGDAFFVQKCMRHIRRFLENGTFLFVTHSTNDVMALCDKAIWLEHGEIVRIGPANEVCRAYLDSLLPQSSSKQKSDASAAAESAPEDTAEVEDAPQEVAEAEGAPEEEGGEPNEPSEEDQPALTQRPRTPKTISISADQLAKLRDYYAPEWHPTTINTASHIEVRQSADAFAKDDDQQISGGGRIFSVEMNDEKGGALNAVKGGEIVQLTIRVVAEKQITRPLVGFQLKNNLGIALIGENTHLPMGAEELPLQPGDVVSVIFRFAVPLLAAGEYVIRAAFHDGTQDDNVVVDVINEAMMLHCITTGEQHGWVGVPLISVEIIRDVDPVEIAEGVGSL